ncbi:MAG TPA: hypothetical protein VLA79_06845 [Polyangia bacterium]|nr:hypothetical protein [Polyangia bacterium]
MIGPNVRPDVGPPAPGKRSRLLRQGSTVAFVAGCSIFSRASTAIVLVIAAHGLSTADLGLFATLFGVAIAAAYVLASTTGNTLAYWARAQPENATKTAGILLAISVVGLALSLPFYLGAGGGEVTAIVIATVLLLVGGVVGTVLMQLLRGLGHLKLAVSAGFLVPSVLRLALSLALISDASVARMLAASSAAAAIGGIVGALLILFPLVAPDRGAGSTYELSVGLSLAAGMVGVMWFLMGQLDLTSLTLLHGSEAGGEYAPTMRAFEAMNALGLAVAFVSIRALAGAAPEAAVARIKEVIRPSLVLYAVVTAPLLIFGHSILGFLLGGDVFWSPAAVVALAIGYGGNLVMALCFETFASQRAKHLLVQVALATALFALLLTPALVARWGIAGAAFGNAFSYLFGGAVAYLSLTRLARPGEA